MGISRRLKLWVAVTLTAVILASSGAYAVKPGNCPRVDYGPYRKYDVAFLYGGQTFPRVRGAASLYANGYFDAVIPVSDESTVAYMTNLLVENGVPPDKIIPPAEYSYDTLSDLNAGNETVRKLGVGNNVAHVSGPVHLRRIRMLNDSLAGGMEPANDGYLPVDDGFGVPFWEFPDFINSDLAAWYACIRDRIRQ